MSAGEVAQRHDYVINEGGATVSEMLEGLTVNRPDLVLLSPYDVVAVRERVENRQARSASVAVICGGGSGHEPAHAGFVGQGLLSAAVCGAVFTSPSTEAVLQAIVAVADRDQGCLLVVKNYTGDRLNFGLARQLAVNVYGIACELLLVADDVAIDAPPHRRRGLAGTLLVYKAACAAAAAGAALPDVLAAARSVAERVYTLSVGLSSCCLPGAATAGRWLPGHMELGLGCHGEPGVQRLPLESAQRLVARLLHHLRTSDKIPAACWSPDARMLVLLNVLTGSTPVEALVLARELAAQLTADAACPAVCALLVGSYLSSLNMAGFSVTLLMQPTDQQLAWLRAPTAVDAWPRQLHAPVASPPLGWLPALRHDTDSTPDDHHAPTLSPDAAARLLARVHRLATACAEPALVAELNQLDKARGDGDTGFTVERGARAVLDHCTELDASRPARLFARLAQLLRTAMGGSSGPVVASFFQGVAFACHQSGSDVAAAFQRGVDCMADLGGATLGDSTMLDALIPAAHALHAHSAWSDVATAARSGAAATADLLPKQGRSFYVGSRALGHVDPGAHLVAHILEQLAIDENK